MFQVLEKQNLTTKDNKNNENQELKKKGFSSLSKEELKILLKNWIRNQEIPKDRDVDMLGTFFTNLVQERKLEYLFSMVNLLYRYDLKFISNL